MKISVLQGYKGLWPNNNEEIETLLKDIPSIIVIGLLSAINSRLYIEGHSFPLQKNLLYEIFLKRQPKANVDAIINALNLNCKRSTNKDPNVEFAIFTERSILKFIESEIINFREMPEEYIDTTPEEELRIFKSILIFNDKTNGEIQYEVKLKANENNNFYYQALWPMCIKQYNIQLRQNYLYQMIKGIILMSELKKDKQLGPYVDLFLKINNRLSIHDYLFEIVNLIEYCDSGKENGYFSRTGFSLNIEKTTLRPTFFDTNCIDITNFKKDPRYNIEFTGIKSKPLVKYKENQYFVLSWVFLQNKLYEGLIFDFIKTTNLEEEVKINYPNFKSKFSDKIVEKIIFKNVMKFILEDKYNVLHFDSGQKQPDCYYRKGNWVLLIEFKDVSFASEAVAIGTYESIKEEIDKKICSPKIGVYQLVEQIKLLAQSTIKFDDKIPSREKLTIQPVIVITDNMFNIPGINKYINDTFKKEIKEINAQFKLISNLIVLNFDFFFNHMNDMKDKTFNIQHAFDDYNNYIKGREKQLKTGRMRSIDFEKSFISFDTYTRKQLTFKKHHKFIETLFKLFDLKHGLPKG
jgi:hypothetical protein